MSDCTSDCSSCSSACGSKKMSKEEMYEPCNEYSKIKKVIGVVSGKGGVGKSFVTSMLASGMNKKGYETAILDADITGPSIPKAFGIKSKAVGTDLGILPAISTDGTKIMSINLLLDSEEMPVVWRGPVIAGTVKQFWSQVVWDKVDYMFIDMPPGTGDVPLTVFQSIPLDGIIIVTSPQELVSMIVEKAVNMAKAMDVPIVGLIENYSYIQCVECEHRMEVFGKSRVDGIGEKYGLEVLGKLPIDPRITEMVDNGDVEKIKIDWFDFALESIENRFIKDFPDNDSLKDQSVKIAVNITKEGTISPKIEDTSTLVIYEIKEHSLVSKIELELEDIEDQKLEGLLKDNGITTFICGGIKENLMKLLFHSGILVVPGMNGEVDTVTAAYLDQIKFTQGSIQ